MSTPKDMKKQDTHPMTRVNVESRIAAAFAPTKRDLLGEPTVWTRRSSRFTSKDIYPKLVLKNSRCGKKSSNVRSICCPFWVSIYDINCHWDRGKGGLSGDCTGKWDPGELKLFTDQRGWKSDLESGGWNGKYCSRCVLNFVNIVIH
jgi:hypothetical protein